MSPSPNTPPAWPQVTWPATQRRDSRRSRTAATLGTVGVVVVGSLGFGVLAKPAKPDDRSAPQAIAVFAPPQAVRVNADSAQSTHLESAEEIADLQTRLAELDYFLPEVTRWFDGATEQAVWALEKVAGLPTDGAITPELQVALEAGVRPAARTTEGKALEFDIERQLLLAVEDGVVVKIFNGSSASGDVYLTTQGRRFVAQTPTGKYAVTEQRDYVHQSSLGLGPMYRPKYFHQVIAIHGADETPPYPSSHGCIRVTNAAMDWIWDTWGAPVGTQVWVY